MANLLSGLFNPALLWAMILNVLNFFFWLLNFGLYLLYTYLWLWPLAILQILKNLALYPFAPFFATCRSNGCEINQAGSALLVALGMLLIVWFLKWQGGRYK